MQTAIDELETTYKQCFKRAATLKKRIANFKKLFPPEVLEVEAGSVSIYEIAQTPEIDFYPPYNVTDAEKHQWANQAIKLFEKHGFVFPQKPESEGQSVSWTGEKQVEFDGEEIKIIIEINNCPVPPGCTLKETKVTVPAREEIKYEVVCMETARQELNGEGGE